MVKLYVHLEIYVIYTFAFDLNAFKWPPVILCIYGAMVLLFERDAGYNLGGLLRS